MIRSLATTLGWVLSWWLILSAMVLALFYPVRTPVGPEWVGHVRLDFQTLIFARIWELNGRETATTALAFELALTLIAAIIIGFTCAMSFTKRDLDRRGTV